VNEKVAEERLVYGIKSLDVSEDRGGKNMGRREGDNTVTKRRSELGKQNSQYDPTNNMQKEERGGRE